MDVLLFTHDSYGTYCGEPKVGSTFILKRNVFLHQLE